MFEHIQPYAGDPIFAVVAAFQADARPHKVNLSIGIYFDEEGRLPVLPSVQQAEQRILAEGGTWVARGTHLTDAPAGARPWPRGRR